MRYVFRVDNSFNLGSGHLMRCLNLAKKLNGEIHFVSRKLPKNNNHLIVKNQFILHEYDSQDIDLEEDLEKDDFFIEKLKEIRPDCVIIDHYGIGADTESEVLKYTKKLLVIDDIDRDHIQACAVLDQNHRKNFHYNSNIQFLGPEFAILDQTFTPTLISTNKIDRLKNIVVYFGASDVGCFTRNVYNICDHFPDLDFIFVLGLNSPDKTFFESLNDERIKFFVKDMANLTSKADLFIGAVGTTSLERAYLGIPSLCVSLSDNQVSIAKNLDEDNIHILLGHIDSVEEQMIEKKILELESNLQILNTLKKNSTALGVQSKIDQVITYLNT